MDEPVMDGKRAREILDRYYPRKRRFSAIISQNSKKWNIIGWGYENVQEYKHCPLDPGIRLIKHPKDGSLLLCPRCGYQASRTEAPKEPDFKTTHQKQQTAIISAKGKKKYYADDGNEIKDPDLFDQHVISYREELPK